MVKVIDKVSSEREMKAKSLKRTRVEQKLQMDADRTAANKDRGRASRRGIAANETSRKIRADMKKPLPTREDREKWRADHR